MGFANCALTQPQIYSSHEIRSLLIEFTKKLL